MWRVFLRKSQESEGCYERSCRNPLQVLRKDGCLFPYCAQWKGLLPVRHLLRKVGRDLRIIRLFGRVIGSLFTLFIWLMALLQLKDGFIAYGFISVGLGTLSALLVIRSIRKSKNF